MVDSQKYLRKTLSRQRYNHCRAVADLASRLAKKYGWDPGLATQAGFLHDCAKEWSPQKLISTARRRRLKIPDFDFIRRHNPNLLHAYVGADLAKRNKWLTNAAALRAISAHTLGALKMGIPEMILYVSDFASKDRAYSAAREVRKEAFRNLRSAFRIAMAKKIKWNLKASKPVHPFTIRVWNRMVRP